MKLSNLVIALFLCIVTLSIYAQPIEGTLLSSWDKEELQGSTQYNNTYNEIWGLAVNGSEYAVIGSTAGTHFINVTDPSNPTEDFFIQGASFGGHIVHRDYHDYKGFLYAVADEDIGTHKSTLQIIDISNLPESVEVVYDTKDRIRKAHNIFIDTSAALLYACAVKGGDDPFAPLRVYDISNPIDPVLVESFRFGIDGVVPGHIHDAYVEDHIAYLNAGGDGLIIADFSDPANPEVLTHLEGTDYPDFGYNHSGWLSEDGKYYYFADESWGKDMKVYDVEDPSNINLVATFDADNDSPNSIPHNQIVHCGYLYSSYYYDGLQVYDISDPESPERVMYFPTTQIPHKKNYEGNWGVYPFLPSGIILASDMQNGLFIIDQFGSCSQTSTEDVQTSLTSEIQVFPNPVESSFQIISEDLITNVRLYSMDGKLLKTFYNHNSSNYNVSDIQAGIYVLSIAQDDAVTVKKIIIR